MHPLFILICKRENQDKYMLQINKFKNEFFRFTKSREIDNNLFSCLKKMFNVF